MKKIHLLIGLFIITNCSLQAQINPSNANAIPLKFDISQNNYTLNDLMAVKNKEFITAKFHLPSMDGIQEFVLQKNNDHYILNGDIEINPLMLIPPIQNKSLGRNDTNYFIDKERWRWPNAEIPVELSADINGTVYNTVKKALDVLNSSTILKFVKRTNQKDYVQFVIDTSTIGAASSLVGWQGGKQLLRIKSNTENSEIVIMHELLHVIGIYHEQSRNDRDDYITIFMDKIKEKAKYNFQKESNTTTYSNYDFCSIMHYDSQAFAKIKGDITIEVKDKKNTNAVNCLNNYPNKMTADDILGIQKYYGISRFPCNIKYFQTPIGLIGEKWLAMGAENSKIGLPIHWEKTCPDGVGKFVYFDNGGAIYYHPAVGTHEVSGEILKEWAKQGYETKKLGYPISDEKIFPPFSTWNDLGYTAYSIFQNGVIMWHPIKKTCKVLTNEEFAAGPPKPISTTIGNATAVATVNTNTYNSPIRNLTINEQILQKGIESNFGPVHSESSKPRPTAGIGGYFLRFEKGWVYYNPNTKKAYSVYGDIMTKWGELGYETGRLGFPRSDVIIKETSYDGLPMFCLFDHGKISWGPEKGAVITYN